MSTLLRCSIVVAIVFAMPCMVAADPLPGRDVLKFSQLPMIKTPVPDPSGLVTGYFGHDEVSTVWIDPQAQVQPTYIGRFMADDFADPFGSPVVHVKWWGSYMNMNPEEDPRRVQRFAIVFEHDVSKDRAIADPNDPYDFSHPDCTGPKYSQLSIRDPDGMLTPMEGTFTERLVLDSNPAEPVFEYNAELLCPFDQQPDTVYWLKIVALVDEPLDDPNRLTWGWHNRDYTIPNPLASKLVSPGEHDQGPLNAGTSFATPIWHFQDDAVGGAVEAVWVRHPCDVHMDQDHWASAGNPSMFAARYVDGEDGPEGIGLYSKDLAFELYTIPEPSTIIALLVGATGLLMYWRRMDRAMA